MALVSIAVVGGAINGLCIAWRLARRGLQGELFERNRCLGATSSASTILDPEVDELEQAISERIKAMIPVRLYGQPADLPPINAIADQHGLRVIKDGAQSFGR